MVTTNEGIFLRAIVAQPVTYVLVAVALQAAGSALRRAARGLWPAPGGAERSTRRAWLSAAWVLLVLGLVTMEGVRTYRAYFVDWPGRPEARNIYNHNLVASARALQDGQVSGAVGMSALFPLYYHDPWIARYVARQDGRALRWFDGRGCVVYPAEGEAQYVLSALTPLDPALRAGFEAQAALVERVALGAADQNPYYERWQWQGGGALEEELDALQATSPAWVSPEVRFTQPEMRRSLETPVPFGDLVALIAYRVNATSFRPGDTLEAITYWRALRTAQAEDDWVTFLHLLDAESQGLGSVDVLHCPPTGWYPGDVVVQVHRFVVAEKALRGKEAYLEIGVYRRTSGLRLPVLADGEPVGDRLLLVPVTIE